MPFPKGFKKQLKLTPQIVGVERREEILNDIAEGSGFLPRGVDYEDMDKSFIKFVEDDLKIEIDGEQVPVLFLTIQRYSEFTKSWKFTDKYRNISMPFISIIRQPDPQVGTNQAGLYNILGRQNWTYYKVPTNDGARQGIDVYKVPQPTATDITYEVRFFTNKMSDLNVLNQKIQKAFNAIQYYIWPKEHPMPIKLEAVGDESNIDDFENRRFYVQNFTMLLQGYILDEDDFVIEPTVNRAMVLNEISIDPATSEPREKKRNRPPIVPAQGAVIIRNSAGELIATADCGNPYIVGNSDIINSGATFSVSVPSTSGYTLENIINYDSDGSPVLTPAMVGFTATTCIPFNSTSIVNTTNSYSAITYESGGTFTLPDTPIKSSGTGFTDTTPSISTGYTIADNIWVDSDGITTGSTEYGTTIVCTPESSPVNPSSFSDPLCLYRSDAGQTLVNGELDIWADQSGNGYNASAIATTNRIRLNMNKGIYGFKDLEQQSKINFYATGLPSASITQFTFDVLIKTNSGFNPRLYGPMIGNINSSSYVMNLQLGNRLEFFLRTAGVLGTVTYTTTDFPSGIIVGESLKLTVVYDGNGVSNNDKFKLYRDGLLVGGAAFAGTIPTSVNNSIGRANISSTSNTRPSTFDVGYFAYWERALTTTEITDNNNWKNQIWD